MVCVRIRVKIKIDFIVVRSRRFYVAHKGIFKRNNNKKTKQTKQSKKKGLMTVTSVMHNISKVHELHESAMNDV